MSRWVREIHLEVTLARGLKDLPEGLGNKRKVLVWKFSLKHNFFDILFLPLDVDIILADCPVIQLNYRLGVSTVKLRLGFVSEAFIRGVLSKKGALKNFANFTRKHLWQSPLFDKVACIFVEKETVAQVFFLWILRND